MDRLETPKSGKARRVPMPALAETFFDLLGERRREALLRGWVDAPEWVYCSEVGTCLELRNVERVWQRVRRRAQKRGVWPLKLHCTRHSWASWALEAGKSVRWVADVLGHADPSLTLRVYAHAMREVESDLSFADLGGTRRPYTAPESSGSASDSRNVAICWRAGRIRTPDPQVRSQREGPDLLTKSAGSPQGAVPSKIEGAAMAPLGPTRELKVVEDLVSLVEILLL
jgi:hypothetical protein